MTRFRKCSFSPTQCVEHIFRDRQTDRHIFGSEDNRKRTDRQTHSPLSLCIDHHHFNHHHCNIRNHHHYHHHDHCEPGGLGSLCGLHFLQQVWQREAGRGGKQTRVQQCLLVENRIETRSSWLSKQTILQKCFMVENRKENT